MPVDKCKLVPRVATSKGFSAFLFEPTEIVSFDVAEGWQKNWQELLLSKESTEQAVWILQHLPCYTLGRGSTEKNLFFDPRKPPLKVHRTDRGGEVTHHMPGQIVVYPVLDLRLYETDLHWYLRKLEVVLIDVLDQLGLEGKRIEGFTGVWIDDRKVAAIGVGCRRWITQHGLALNVDCDLLGYESVRPCGLNHQIGRLKDWIPGITLAEVQSLVKDSLANHFKLNWKQ